MASVNQPQRTEEVFLNPKQQMMASGAGALMVSLFMTPLDVVKIRLQTQDQIFAKKCFLYSNGIMDHLCPRTNGDPPVRAIHTAEEICNCKWYNRPKYFNGTLDAIVKISRTEGISSLWSGLSPTLVLAIPTTMIYFTAYEQLKSVISKQVNKYNVRKEMNDLDGDAVKNLHNNSASAEVRSPVNHSKSNMEGLGYDEVPEQSPAWISLVSGGIARIGAVSIVSPLELIRTKMQSQKMAFYQVRSCLADLIKTRGITGLWSGYTATLLRDVPFSALYWPLYEQTKYLMGRESYTNTFVSGAVAGSVASTITLPFDVLKTMKQIEMGEKDIMDVKSGVSRTNREIFRGIIKEQGVKGLFSGLTPRILKVAPACAIMISSYEFFKNFFKMKNLETGVS